MKKRYALSAIFALTVLSTIAQADKTILVLDASGSMWEQIDSKPKIEIAREAVKTILSTWPADQDLGLVAYGHRSKGNCNDIETLITAGKLDAVRMTKTIDGLVPKGKTPLSAAVKQAAEALKYTEDKATVILVSDGKETCDKDPCALGAELEKAGVNFTAHVIGFDVAKVEDQAGLKCLAENTGGKFIAAANANELQAALVETTQAPPAPEPKPTPAPEPIPSAKITAPKSAEKGTLIKIEHQAEKSGLEGHVYLYANGKDESITYGYVRPDNDGYQVTELRLAATAGEYILRWKDGQEQLLAETPITVTEAQMAIKVPESATQGTLLKVALTAPDSLEGHVHLFAKDKDQSITYGYVRPNPQGGYLDAELRLPIETGDYVVKWLTDRNELLAEAPLKVIDSEIKLEVPASAPKATLVKIGLNAPDGLEGHVHIFAKGKDQSITYGYVRENPVKGYEATEITLPATPGDYEIKWLSDRKELLASAPITVTEADIKLSAPEQIQKSTELKIALTGPDGLGGHVHLFAKGKDQSITYGYVRPSSTQGYEAATLTMPDQLGDYTLRWLTERNEVLTEAPIKVVEQISE
jgi:Ca-activated chloride channel family protein